MFRLYHPIATAVTALLVAACAAPPLAPATTARVPIVADAWTRESDERLRARALETIDAGDLRLAAEVLHALRARAGGNTESVRALLASIAAIATPSAHVVPHPYANAPVVVASPAPEPPSSEATSGPPVPWKIRDDDNARGIAEALGDTYFPSPEYRHAGTARPVEYPAAVPAKLAGYTLLLLRPSGGHWLALYGRERADARFVAVLRDDGSLRALVDFAQWRAKNAIADAGISWAELDGDVLYVKTEVFAYDGFVAAVDLKTGKTLWRSERVAYAYNFVVADEAVVLWRWQPRSTLLVLDRKTGATRSRTDMTLAPPAALSAQGGVVLGANAPKLPDNQVVEIAVRTHEAIMPRDLGHDVAPSAMIPPSTPLSGVDVASRARGWAELDAGHAANAVSVLREVLERRPGNFATDALYTHALATLHDAHARAGALLRGVAPVRVHANEPDARAHIHVERAARAPRLRMVSESETRRHSTAWFAESGAAPNQFDTESGAAPGPYPVTLAPEWLPDELLGARLSNTWTQGDDVVAIYDARYVVVFERGTFRAALDFGGPRDKDALRVSAGALAGDALLVTVRPSDSRRPFAAALDMTTGTPAWTTAGVEGAGFVVMNGYAITSSAPKAEQADIVELEADTGRIVQRVRAPKSFPSAYRLARQGNVLFGFGYVHSCTLTIE